MPNIAWRDHNIFILLSFSCSFTCSLLFMGMKKGSSWLTAIRRAFRSPSSQHNEPHQQEEERKRGKKRWKFRKSTGQDQQEQHKQVIAKVEVTAEQRRAIAMAVVGAATSGAAVATVQAAAEVMRLKRPMNHSFVKEHHAAVVIQTAFRGCLARRAMRALKGLVKLQALVRGHNVRKQVNTTLICMQALLRVQAKVREERMRLSQDGAGCSSTKSSHSCDTSLWDYRYVQEMAERKSMLSSFTDDLDDRPRTIEEIQTMLQSRKGAHLKSERVGSSAFSHQTRGTDKNIYQPLDEEEETELAELEQEPTRRVDRWMASRSSIDNQPRRGARGSTSSRTDPIKPLEIDAGRPSINRKQLYQSTPSPLRAKSIQVRSGSPRCIREDRTSISSKTPSFTACYNYSGNGVTRHQQTTMPNYMAATESARARVRSHSAPKQRPGTPERDQTGPVKKRLSFPVPDSYNYYNQSLRSPSFKSTMGRVEHMSNVSSSCGGEVSPSSTADLRRWLR